MHIFQRVAWDESFKTTATGWQDEWSDRDVSCQREVNQTDLLWETASFQPNFLPNSYAKNPRLLGIDAAIRERKAGPPGAKKRYDERHKEREKHAERNRES